MQITIIKPGLLSTIQDLGRVDFLSQAVPISGAMDTLSARITNLAVGNSDTEAVIEFTYGNASFKCDTDILLSYCGNGATLQSHNEKLPAARAIFLKAGTIVNLKNTTSGARTYLAVPGGWDLPLVLNSRSTYTPAGFGGYEGRALKVNDWLSGSKKLSKTNIQLLNDFKNSNKSYARWGIYEDLIRAKNQKVVRIILGGESNWFDETSIVDLLSKTYTIDLKSNRMGIYLKGSKLKRVQSTELLSTAVCPGTIQVNGDGEMILLMADCQTTGGYPRIAQVALVDLPICAQLKPGDEILFEEISPLAAEKLYLKQERDLAKLALAIEMIL